MLSIIIPTLNEEKHLPRLLKNIKDNSLENYEIIVADNNSKDKTRQIAKKYRCKIVQGGLPSKAKNNGAKAARGSLLFFIDADCNIDKTFFNKALNEINQTKSEVAACYVWPSTKNILINFEFGLYNFWLFLTQLFYANASHGIFCSKKIHGKIKGFDEEIKLSEDMDYVKKASKFGKFRILKNVKISTSARRFEQEGAVKTGLKLILSGLYRVFLGEIKTDVFKYRFKHKK